MILAVVKIFDKKKRNLRIFVISVPPSMLDRGMCENIDLNGFNVKFYCSVEYSTYRASFAANGTIK